MANDFKLGDYVQVDERIAEFREKHPDGSLQPVNPDEPYTLEVIGEQVFIVYKAAAYRNHDDPRPGIGCAWEPFPGRTPYTKNSELMNAETSAWGRAIIAALAADAKRGIASAEEVRNRAAERDVPDTPTKTTKKAPAASRTPARSSGTTAASDKQVQLIHILAKKAGYGDAALAGMLKVRFGTEHASELNKADASQVIEGLQKAVDGPSVDEQLTQAGFDELPDDEVPF